jgi:hypothetical protein
VILKPPKETTQRINEIKSWFFEKINNIDKPLAHLAKRRKEKTHINKNRDSQNIII